MSSGFNERPCLKGQDSMIDQCLPLVSMCMHGYVPTHIPPKCTHRSSQIDQLEIGSLQTSLLRKWHLSQDHLLPVILCFVRVPPWCLTPAPSIPPCLPHLEWVLLFVCSMARGDWHPHTSLSLLTHCAAQHLGDFSPLRM